MGIVGAAALVVLVVVIWGFLYCIQRDAVSPANDLKGKLMPAPA